ncbi:MAG: hypothetical protein R3E96_03775 [Planctomycetota bacterium]
MAAETAGDIIEMPPERLELMKTYLADADAIPRAADGEAAEPYWQLVMPELQRLDAMVRADGGQFLVLYFPSAGQYQKWKAMPAEEALAMVQAGTGESALAGELRRRCEAAGIRMEDCSDVFIGLQGNAFDGKDPGHPGPTGLQALAQRVAQIVRNR